MHAEKDKEKSIGRQLLDQNRIAEYFKHQRIGMLDQASLVKLSVIIQGRLFSLGDVFSHESGNSHVAVHHPEVVLKERETENRGEDDDQDEDCGPMDMPF